MRLNSTMTILAALALISSTQAPGHEKSRVTGSYSAAFVQLALVNEHDGFLYFDVTIAGPFELTVGNMHRTGTVTYPHIAKIIADFADLEEGENPGALRGGAVWVFDDGTTCLGFVGGDLVPPLGFHRGQGEFDCSDGSTLRLKVTDTSVDPAVGVEADLSGVLLSAHDGH